MQQQARRASGWRRCRRRPARSSATCRRRPSRPWPPASWPRPWPAAPPPTSGPESSPTACAPTSSALRPAGRGREERRFQFQGGSEGGCSRCGPRASAAASGGRCLRPGAQGEQGAAAKKRRRRGQAAAERENERRPEKRDLKNPSLPPKECTAPFSVLSEPRPLAAAPQRTPPAPQPIPFAFDAPLRFVKEKGREQAKAAGGPVELLSPSFVCRPLSPHSFHATLTLRTHTLPPCSCFHGDDVMAWLRRNGLAHTTRDALSLAQAMLDHGAFFFFSLSLSLSFRPSPVERAKSRRPRAVQKEREKKRGQRGASVAHLAMELQCLGGASAFLGSRACSAARRVARRSSRWRRSPAPRRPASAAIRGLACAPSAAGRRASREKPETLDGLRWRSTTPRARSLVLFSASGV